MKALLQLKKTTNVLGREIAAICCENTEVTEHGYKMTGEIGVTSILYEDVLLETKLLNDVDIEGFRSDLSILIL